MMLVVTIAPITIKHARMAITITATTCKYKIGRGHADGWIIRRKLTDKAAITHWRIDGQSGDEGGSFLRLIRP